MVQRIGPKVTALLGIVVAFGLCLYPPFKCVGHDASSGFSVSGGHYWVFSPPQSSHYNTGRSAYAEEYEINADLLVGELLFTVIGTIALAAILHHLPRGKEQVKDKYTNTSRRSALANS